MYPEKSQMKLYSKYPGCTYDPASGDFYRISMNNSYDRKLIPDELGNISYFCYFKKKPVKKKASTLAWEILNTKEVPDLHVVYFKDLDSNNLKAHNLGLIKKEDYRLLQDSLENLDGGIRLQSHPTDAYVYYVKFRANGRVQQTLCHDIAKALKLKRAILVKSSRAVSRFVVSRE